MNNLNKYLGLMLLMMGVFFGFIILVALIIVIMRFLSIALFSNRISENIFRYFIIIIPYLIFSAAYYYLYTKINETKNKLSKRLAALFLIIGCLICITAFVLSTLIFLSVKNTWLQFFDDNSGYNLVMQLIVVFLTSAILAFGDPQEKDWKEKSLHNNS
jgi:hypothetical protein